MRLVRISKPTILLALFLFGAMGVFVTPAIAASEEYGLNFFPFYSQEGSTITIVLTVRNPQTPRAYSFDFLVRDPSTTIWTSSRQNYTTVPGETEFQLFILFPSPEFPCSTSCPSTSLAGGYLVAVNQITPIPPRPNPVAQASFAVGLVDKPWWLFYQRTETVSIVATEYSPLENVNVTIRTTVTSTVVYFHQTLAASNGRVTDSWYVPKNATITEDYVVTVTGTTTSKNPPDVWGFTAQAAFMTISSLSSSKSSYQRTETFSFSFQPTYPSGEIASTGLGLVTLARPGGSNFTLPANYNSTTQTFVAKYKTSATDQNGTWTASLIKDSYNDGLGDPVNSGPALPVSTSPDLLNATFLVNMMTKSTFAAFEQIRFNATIQYPDSTNLQAGTVTSTLSYSGGGYSVNVYPIFDSGLQLWVGTYNPQGNEPSGGWSLRVDASDSAIPANSGFSTRAITIQNRPPTATFTGSTSSAPTGVSISFNSAGSSDSDGTIVSYLWDYGDGSTGYGATSTHSYAVPGTYTVRLTTMDNGGLTSSATQTVTVTAAPQSGDNASLPLFYFAILAGALAAAIGGAVFAFKRHKVTHARLKIDLDAVRTEAGRIENQEFFQSVKDQLKKDKDD